MFIFVASVALMISTVSAGCGSGDYNNFLTCLHDSIATQWNRLESELDGKIQADEDRFQNCFSSSGCPGAVDFSKDWVGLLDDAAMVTLAEKIRNFWDSAPRAMQECVLRDARDKFFDELEDCVQHKGPADFALPHPYPHDLPMPSQAMYSQHRPLLIKAIADILNLLLSAKDCSSGDRQNLVRCMKEETDNDLRTCVSGSLCNIPDCSEAFPQVCSSVSSCILDIIHDAGAALSKLQDDNKNEVLDFMAKCEGEARTKEHSNWKYSRVQVLEIYRAITAVSHAGLGDRFKSLVTDLITAYFDGSSFCATTCQSRKRRWLQLH